MDSSDSESEEPLSLITQMIRNKKWQKKHDDPDYGDKDEDNIEESESETKWDSSDSDYTDSSADEQPPAKKWNIQTRSSRKPVMDACHELLNNRSSDILECSICESRITYRSSATAYILQHHAFIHANKPLYKCMRCEFKGTTLWSLRRHLKSSHNIDKSIAKRTYILDDSWEYQQEILDILTKCFVRKAKRKANKSDTSDRQLANADSPPELESHGMDLQDIDDEPESYDDPPQLGADRSLSAMDDDRSCESGELDSTIDLAVQYLSKAFNAKETVRRTNCDSCGLLLYTKMRDDTYGAFINHVYVHLRKYVFGCGMCMYKGVSIVAIQGHLENAHSLKITSDRLSASNGPYWTNSVEEYRDQFLALMKRCFPSSAGSTWQKAGSKAKVPVRRLVPSRHYPMIRSMLEIPMGNADRPSVKSKRSVSKPASSSTSITAPRVVINMTVPDQQIGTVTNPGILSGNIFIRPMQASGATQILINNIPHTLVLVQSSPITADQQLMQPAAMSNCVSSATVQSVQSVSSSNTIAITAGPQPTRATMPSNLRSAPNSSSDNIVDNTAYQYLTQLYERGGKSGNFHCNLCLESLMTTSDRVRNAFYHAVSAHLGKNLYSCKICGYVAYRNSNITNHIKSAHKSIVDGNYVDHTFELEGDLMSIMARCYGKQTSHLDLNEEPKGTDQNAADGDLDDDPVEDIQISDDHPVEDEVMHHSDTDIDHRMMDMDHDQDSTNTKWRLAKDSDLDRISMISNDVVQEKNVRMHVMGVHQNNDSKYADTSIQTTPAFRYLFETFGESWKNSDPMCGICKKVVKVKDGRWTPGRRHMICLRLAFYHAATHLDQKLFTCIHCHYKTSFKKYIWGHMKNVHTNSHGKYLDHTGELGNELLSIMIRCYSEKDPGTNSDEMATNAEYSNIHSNTGVNSEAGRINMRRQDIDLNTNANLDQAVIEPDITKVSALENGAPNLDAVQRIQPIDTVDVRVNHNLRLIRTQFTKPQPPMMSDQASNVNESIQSAASNPSVMEAAEIVIDQAPFQMSSKLSPFWTIKTNKAFRYFVQMFKESGILTPNIQCKYCTKWIELKRNDNPAYWNFYQAFHHATGHLDEPVYSCKHCSLTAGNKDKMRYHVYRAHKVTATGNYVDRSNEFVDQLIAVIKLCYPFERSGTSSNRHRLMQGISIDFDETQESPGSSNGQQSTDMPGMSSFQPKQEPIEECIDQLPVSTAASIEFNHVSKLEEGQLIMDEGDDSIQILDDHDADSQMQVTTPVDHHSPTQNETKNITKTNSYGYLSDLLKIKINWKCNLCHKSINMKCRRSRSSSNLQAAFYHAADEHLHERLFSCTGCRFEASIKETMKRHLRTYHKMTSTGNYVDHTFELDEKLLDIMVRCYEQPLHSHGNYQMVHDQELAELGPILEIPDYDQNDDGGEEYDQNFGPDQQPYQQYWYLQMDGLEEGEYVETPTVMVMPAMVMMGTSDGASSTTLPGNVKEEDSTASTSNII